MKGVRRKDIVSEVQSVLFDKNLFSTKQAQEWLDSHNYHSIKGVHITANKLRYRQTEPGQYKRFRTENISRGIEFVLGIK